MSTELATMSALDVMPQAFTLAERIARTEFVPGALRGKPEAVLAAILTGHELGIGPMQALAKIHVIDGRPAMSAELMRAVILRAGHELAVEEATVTKVTVAGRRAGSETWSRVTWTMDDAKRAGLEQRQPWRKYPRAMLLARATGELARMIFADALAGVSYTEEELADGDLFALDDIPAAGTAAPAAPTARKARAKRAATAPAAGPAPALPGEDPTIEDADVIDVAESPAAADATSPAPATGEGNGAPVVPLPGEQDDVDAKRRAQQVAMWCQDAGISTDTGRHAFLRAFSDGAYSSAKDVPVDHLRELRAALVRLSRGELELEVTTEVDDKGIVGLITATLRETNTGLPSSDPGGQAIGRRDGVVNPDAPIEPEQPALDILDETYWRTEIAKVPGVGAVKLLNAARNLALELGVDQPTGLDEITDPGLAGAVRAWLVEA